MRPEPLKLPSDARFDSQDSDFIKTGVPKMAESINTDTQLPPDPESVAEMEKYGITKKSIEYYFYGALTLADTIGGLTFYLDGDTWKNSDDEAVDITMTKTPLNLRGDYSVNGKLGIGLDVPASPLHVVQGADGGFNLITDEAAIFQRNANSADNCTISITAGSAGLGIVRFGDVDSSYIGQLVFNNSDNSFSFLINNAPVFKVHQDGGVVLPYIVTNRASARTNQFYVIGTNETVYIRR